MAGNLLCPPSTLCLDTLFTSSDKKISGFTRPHVIGFVADIFFSTLESGFIFFRIRCRIRRIRVDGSRIRKEKVADSKISGYVWTGPEIFCRIPLKRIDKAIDSTLREEQAGFRRGRGCVDQIFTLRNILEQSLEWNTSLCINIIDFQKVFDSVHRKSLWKILQAYGLPPKIVNLIKMFYDNFECSIILGNTITEAFPVKSGVRQSCILSPVLFLVTIDWVMRQAPSLRSRRIQWTIFSHLQDLDFADDIVILSSTPTHPQEKSDDLNTTAKRTGLIISKKKSKIMCVKSDASRPINIEGEPLEHIEDFTYLGSVISQTTVPRWTSRLGSTKPGVLLVDSKTSGSLSSIASRLQCASTTVALTLCYSTALNAGELSRGT